MIIRLETKHICVRILALPLVNNNKCSLDGTVADKPVFKLTLQTPEEGFMQESKAGIGQHGELGEGWGVGVVDPGLAS